MTSTGSGCGPGDRVLDMGCGAGRHAFEMYRRGADVVAFDQDADELSGVLDLFGAMRDAGEVPAGAEADVKQGDALSLPFADGEFDRVVAAEVLEHIPADTERDRRAGRGCCAPAARWRSPCRAGCPRGSAGRCRDDYHEVEGGHVRIYTGDELVGKLAGAGLVYEGTRLRARRCTRRTGGSSARSAWTTTSTRWCGPTTGCWSGTS